MKNIHHIHRALCGSLIVIFLGLVIQAKAEDLDLNKMVSTRDGFLKRVRHRQPNIPHLLLGRVDPLFDRICESAERFLVPLKCAPTVIDQVGVKNFLPPPIIAADLPHLRLNILLTRMEHQAVSGGGVPEDPNDLSDDLWAHWKIQSTAATSSIPGPVDEPYGLPVPQNPGEVWPLDHNNALFQGIISNGCSNTTVFDVDLVSDVFRLNSTTLGAVHLQDEVVGHGFYVFSYTIRATDPNGGVSDFIFSGDAIAYCTAQESF